MDTQGDIWTHEVISILLDSVKKHLQTGKCGDKLWTNVSIDVVSAASVPRDVATAAGVREKWVELMKNYVENRARNQTNLSPFFNELEYFYDNFRQVYVDIKRGESGPSAFWTEAKALDLVRIMSREKSKFDNDAQGKQSLYTKVATILSKQHGSPVTPGQVKEKYNRLLQTYQKITGATKLCEDAGFYDNLLSFVIEEGGLEDANDKKVWPRQHIEMLVALYQEQEEAFEPINSAFWKRVSASFLEDGIRYSSAQCQTKMKNMKRQYRLQKDKAERIGPGKVAWEYFELMKRLMDSKQKGTDAIPASSRGELRIPANSASQSQSSLVLEGDIGVKDPEPKRAKKLQNASFERCPMADVISQGVDLRQYPISSQFCSDKSTPSSSSIEVVQEISAVKEEPAPNVSFANDKKAWPRQHIEMLVAFYQEQEKSLKPVNSVFWSRVSASFLEDGIHYSSAQCQTKMETLKRQYRDHKDKAGQSGAGKVAWEYFELMKGLMAPNPEGTDAITASSRGGLRIPANSVSRPQSSPVPEADEGGKDPEPKRAKKLRSFSEPEGFQQLTNDVNLRHQERLRFEREVHQEKMKYKRELLEVKKELLKTVKTILEKIE
ncbi:uncharacterized protein LOC136026210 isoform X2 [Artemia franciscana]